ncbi:alpha/beta fold hydrolase [Pseudonocardia lacus]|uniref:alpha/beta fold hydrolase n=1 Tax=Pseudonocardia lacus TaxID=2835865 RepID=UPI001BDC916F|nr:alpha/beta hydrolase [Pseudonocardia lacus]
MRRPGPDPSSVRWPGPWTHRGVSANGIRLHVAECDGGRPLVVLLHGFPQLWWAWRHQLPALAGHGYRVAAVDLRGYGDSDKPPRGYDLWTLAGDVAGLVRALGEPRAHLVGHGWGGLIGWTVAALHPRLVRSLTVLGAPHPLAVRRAVLRDPRGQGRATARHALRMQVPRLPERALVADDGAGAERVIRAWAGPDWAGSDDFAAAAPRYRQAARISGVAHCSAEYYRWAVRSQLRAEGRRFAAAVARPAEVPVLAVHGELDPCAPVRTAAASQEWVADKHRLDVLPTIGHFPHEEDPVRTTRLIADFLPD